MLRIVADTNIYVSALHVGGVADTVLGHARARSVQLFVSGAILQELEHVLVRKLGWGPRQARAAIASVRDFATFVTPSERLAVIPNDDADNRILECAATARARLVVTGDRLLQDLGTFRGIRIISPRQLLEVFGQAQE